MKSGYTSGGTADAKGEGIIILEHIIEGMVDGRLFGVLVGRIDRGVVVSVLNKKKKSELSDHGGLHKHISGPGVSQ